jgi:nucleoside-diphosphate-sugar epimerase
MTDGSCVIGITGASGNIGTALIQALSKCFRIIGLDRPGPPHPPPVADCVSIDVTSDESVQQALQTVRERYGRHIGAIIHLAAYYSFSGAPSPKYEEINVAGTERLMRALRPFEVERLIYASTMLVHAPTVPGRPIDESWPLNPKWAYPESKVDAERLLREQHSHIPLTVLRIAGMYTDDVGLPLLASQIQRIYERRLISHFFPGNPHHGQALIHLDDLVEAFKQLVLRRRDLPGDITLLLGEDRTLSYLDLQHAIGELLHGRPWPTYRVPKPLAKVGAYALDALPGGEREFIRPWMIGLADDHYELDISAARRQLDWQPHHFIGTELPRLIARLREDPMRWYKTNHLPLPAAVQRSAAGPR